jgi:hypothetical protein
LTRAGGFLKIDAVWNRDQGRKPLPGSFFLFFNGKRFVVPAGEKPTAFLELESTIRD